jgi:hypothetical protein
MIFTQLKYGLQILVKFPAPKFHQKKNSGRQRVVPLEQTDERSAVTKVTVALFRNVLLSRLVITNNNCIEDKLLSFK